MIAKHQVNINNLLYLTFSKPLSIIYTHSIGLQHKTEQSELKEKEAILNV